MAPSNAPRSGRGVFSPNGTHARATHDADEDVLFALSLDDVMSDRPWTADELTGTQRGSANMSRLAAEQPVRRAENTAAAGSPRSSSSATARPATDPSETAAFLAAAARSRTTDGPTSHVASAPSFSSAAGSPYPATGTPGPSAHASSASETVGIPAQCAAVAAQSASATVAIPAQRAAAAAASAAAVSAMPTPSAPAAPKPPASNRNDFASRQAPFDTRVAADLDETSTGMPVLDGPVNPLYANPGPDYAPHGKNEADTARPDATYRNASIDTEGYASDNFDYSADPFAPTPEYSAYPTMDAYVDTPVSDMPANDAVDDRFNDYRMESEPPRFSQFPQAAKVAFIAIVVALLGLIGFECFQLFHGATQAESEVQQKEDSNTDYLDINTLKGDPNDGESSE